MIMNQNIERSREYSRFDQVCASVFVLGKSALQGSMASMRNSRRMIATKLSPELAYEAELAYIDEDTGLPNKRAMHKRFAELMRQGTSFGAVMVDIDKFKLVNEQFGHSRADQLLASYAKKLQGHIRPDDGFFLNSTAYRTGGDEFIILAPLTGREDMKLSDEERLESLVTRLNQDYLETEYEATAGGKLTMITATAYGEVVDPRSVTGDGLQEVLGNISLGMLSRKLG